ncbi:MAG: hypothetical protein J7M39_14645 [Anaerolineae bacterium]|nr:hypothetical protein [Anaerolineae bacterium]
MDSPNLYIVDANILIDLDNGTLIEALFAMPYSLATPDFVVAEFNTDQPDHLIASQLEVVGCDSEEIGEILTIGSHYSGLSFVDSAALFLANTRGATLLTGDRALRNAATAEGVAVHGVLWVLDEMLYKTVIDTQRACAALDAVLVGGARLPQAACQARRNSWGCP